MTVNLIHRPDLSVDSITMQVAYATDVDRKLSGLEFRASLTPYPRIDYGFTASLLDVDGANQLRADLYNRSEVEWRVPLWHAPSFIDLAAGPLDTALVGTFPDADFAPGQYFYIETPDKQTAEIHQVDFSSALMIAIDGTSIAGTYPIGSSVYPMVSGFLSDGQAISREKVNLTYLPVALQVNEFRSLGGLGGVVNTYQGKPLVEPRHLAPGRIEDRFHRGIFVHDFGFRQARTAVAPRASIHTSRTYEVITRADLQYWKKLLDTTRGGWKSVYVPTWRADMDLVAQPAGGASTLVVTDDPNFATEWEASEAHQDLQLEGTFDGVEGTIQRRITNVTDNLDGTVDITLDAVLPAAVQIDVVSFLELSVLGDVAQFVFNGPVIGYADGALQIDVRTVRQ